MKEVVNIFRNDSNREVLRLSEIASTLITPPMEVFKLRWGTSAASDVTCRRCGRRSATAWIRSYSLQAASKPVKSMSVFIAMTSGARTLRSCTCLWIWMLRVCPLNRKGMRGPLWKARVSAAKHSIGPKCGCLPAWYLTEPFCLRASMGIRQAFWHRCNSVSHFSVSSRGDCGRHGSQLRRRSCSRSTRAIVRQALSSIVSRHGGWDSELACQCPRAQTGQRHGRSARQGAHCFGGHLLRWQLRRASARIVFERGARLGLFAKFALFSEFGMEAITMKCVRHWRELQGTAGQLRAQRGQRGPCKDRTSDVLGTLVPFRHLLSQRLVHLGARLHVRCCHRDRAYFLRSPRRSIRVWRMGAASSPSRSWIPTCSWGDPKAVRYVACAVA